MKPKVEIDLRGPDGNIYAAMARVVVARRHAGQGEQEAELKSRVLAQGSYKDALKVLEDYADITWIE